MPNNKDTYYFSHDSNAASDHKILQMCSVYGAEGYGWYWMIIERMREEPDYRLMVNGKYSVNAFALHMYCAPEKLQQFLDDCVDEFHLFRREDGHIWSESLVRRMAMVEEKSEKARESALSRWNRNANAKPPQSKSNPNHMQLNESKLNESKLNESKLNESKLNESKLKYGEFNNVLLTKEEYEKLESRYGVSLKEKIETLSVGIESKGYKYKSHYATILAWDRKDSKNNNKTLDYNTDKPKYEMKR